MRSWIDAGDEDAAWGAAAAGKLAGRDEEERVRPGDERCRWWEKIASSGNDRAYNGGKVVSSSEKIVDEPVVLRDNGFSLSPRLLFSIEKKNLYSSSRDSLQNHWYIAIYIFALMPYKLAVL